MKILIVDDEPDFVEMIKIRLEASHYEVIDAPNGEIGLKKAEKEKPDLILLDIMMPKKNGYQMLRELKTKQETESIPVIVVTAKPGMEGLFDVEGVRDYIVKPFEDIELLLRVKKVLDEQE